MCTNYLNDPTLRKVSEKSRTPTGAASTNSSSTNSSVHRNIYCERVWRKTTKILSIT